MAEETEELIPKYKRGQEVFFWDEILDNASKGMITEIHDVHNSRTNTHELEYILEADVEHHFYDNHHFLECNIFATKKACLEEELRRTETKRDDAENIMQNAEIKIEMIQDRIRKIDEEQGFDENERTRVLHLLQESDTMFHSLTRMVNRGNFGGESPQKFVDFVKQMAREAEVLVQNYNFRHSARQE